MVMDMGSDDGVCGGKGKGGAEAGAAIKVETGIGGCKSRAEDRARAGEQTQSPARQVKTKNDIRCSRIMLRLTVAKRRAGVDHKTGVAVVVVQ